MNVAALALQILADIADGNQIITHVWSNKTTPVQNDGSVWRVTIYTAQNHKLTLLVSGTNIVGLIELVDDGRKIIGKRNPVSVPSDIKTNLARIVFLAHAQCCTT